MPFQGVGYLPARDIETDSLRSLGPLAAFRQGEADQIAANERNAMREIGETAASRGFLPAAEVAMRRGYLDTATTMRKHAIDLRNADRDTMLKAFSFLAAIGDKADTPEKWKVGYDTARRIFGDVIPEEYADFSMRPKAISALQEAEIKLKEAQAEYWSSGGRAGATERLAERLMQENPDLDFDTALRMARSGSGADRRGMENLAQRAAKNDPLYAEDPEASLTKWRKYYGIDTESSLPSMGAMPESGSRVGAFAQPGIGGGALPPPPEMPTFGAKDDAKARAWRDKARDAIGRGAPREQVLQRLRDNGIDTSGL